MNFVYVSRRKKIGNEIVDLGMVEIPKKDLTETLKRNPLWQTMGNIGVVGSLPKPKPIECPLCDKPFATNQELDVHKRTHV